jgi:Fe-S-cluster-containing hydrogenase component 2
MNKVIFETTGCGGCRTCEIACSYHHKKIFSPNLSSIEIIDRPEDPGFAVSFYILDTDKHLACDKCEGEKEPLCLKYCSVFMHERLKEILQNELPNMPAKEMEYEKR